MKKPVLIIVLFLSNVLFYANATIIPLEKTNPTTTTPRPRSLMLFPVTVDLSLTNLYLNFTNSIGLAIISVKDSNDIIVFQESIDTNSTNELNIAIDGWEIDDYTIEISYGSTILIGTFSLE